MRILNKIKIPDSLTKILNFIAYKRLFLFAFIILSCCIYIIKILVEVVLEKSDFTFQSLIFDHIVFFLVLIVILLLFGSFQLICPTKCNQTLSFITTNWIVFSVTVLFLGCLYYNIPPLYTLDDARFNHQQEILKRNYIDFHNDLGTKLLNVRQISAATDEFQKVLNVSKLDQKATNGLFECDVFRSIWNKSTDPEILYMQLDELKKKATKDDALPFIYLGDFAFLHESSMDAIPYYEKALNITHNESAAAAETLGTIYSQENKPDKAIHYFHIAANLSKWNMIYRNNLAYEHYDSGDYDTAIYYYNSTKILDPNYLDLYTGLSNSYRLIGDLKNARENQKQQIDSMENNGTKDLSNNNRNFSGRTNSGKIADLDTYDLKKYYYYYNIALTYYLSDKDHPVEGHVEKADYYVNQANALQLDQNSKLKVKDIVSFDIKCLQEKRSEYRNETNEFKNKYGIK